MHLTVEEFAYGFAHFFEWRASTAMYITCWKGCFLITKALALPAAASSFPDLQDTKSLNIDTILNTTLVGDDLPYGPPIFTVDIDDAVSATGNHNRLEFEYEHIDGPMDQGAIFMGSIGAIFKVAGETGYDFDLFVSSFPEYDFCTFWSSNTRPSQFTFGMLIQVIVGAAKYAVAKNVWRELIGRVFVGGVKVANGGWIKVPPMPTGVGQCLSDS